MSATMHTGLAYGGMRVQRGNTRGVKFGTMMINGERVSVEELKAQVAAGYRRFWKRRGVEPPEFGDFVKVAISQRDARLKARAQS